jgi:4-hydroxyphenylpyruvate dioxygenase
MILDSFHTLALGDDLTGLDAVPAEKIVFLQLADAPLLSQDVLSWSRHHRNFPGQGQLDVTGFLRAVLDAGYTGPVSLEIFNDDFRAMPARITARDALRSLVALGAAAGESVLPAPPVFAGVEFIEFAVDEPARDALAAFIAPLGFHRVGMHRSKNVELWRQGQINLVLNAEQDTAASEHFLLHGPSVCAVALRVDDAARALSRARALLCPDWQERTGSGERQIPALRAPDGTLIYLVAPSGTGRSIFEDDFVLAAPAAEPGLPMTIDHIAQALPAGRMDSYVLFYATVFGFSAQATFELPDPYGLIRSRAMVSADGSVRLPLNISESRETGTGRFVSAFAGAGVQHIALATPDIFATAAELRAVGCQLLPIPPNYYDDLVARHGLDDALLARLQAANLLFDRDEHGDFLHGFTETFDDRFFFEIVQRDGYAGFGAANAGVRMAVQAQRRDAGRLGVRLEVL